jgi:zinc transporter ZupT
VERNVIIAFAPAALAGLSTGIGSAIALLAKRTNTRFLSFALGLSAGAMLYVCFVELLATSFRTLGEAHGERAGAGITVFIPLDELLPAARKCTGGHLAITGVGAGTARHGGEPALLISSPARCSPCARARP